MLAAGMLVFEGLPHLSQLPVNIVAWIGYNGLIGMGLAYFLWFSVIGRLPAMTASLGSLLVPVVGVTASTLILGERPTLPDIVGFAAIWRPPPACCCSRAYSTPSCRSDDVSVRKLI